MTSVTPLPAAHRSADTPDLDIARIEDSCPVLGPGRRRVVWVQGCALRCPGCVVPESHPRGVGTRYTPAELAERLLDGPDIDGVTFSGGEPMLQALGLVGVVRPLRAARPHWSFMSYTGYLVETLLARGTEDQKTFLSELDICVEGPYVRGLAGDLLWRGSSNQQLRALSPVGVRLLDGRDDTSAGVVISLSADGRATWSGIPPEGFRDDFDAALDELGLA